MKSNVDVGNKSPECVSKANSIACKQVIRREPRLITIIKGQKECPVSEDDCVRRTSLFTELVGFNAK